MWDKNKIYGFSDEEILKKHPTDNEVAKEGCDEVLTKEEIHSMFPNQIVIIEICDYNVIPEYWNTGKVLWYQCSQDFAFKFVLENNSSGMITYEPTFSTKVGGLFDICSLN